MINNYLQVKIKLLKGNFFGYLSISEPGSLYYFIYTAVYMIY